VELSCSFCDCFSELCDGVDAVVRHSGLTSPAKLVKRRQSYSRSGKMTGSTGMPVSPDPGQDKRWTKKARGGRVDHFQM